MIAKQLISQKAKFARGPAGQQKYFRFAIDNLNRRASLIVARIQVAFDRSAHLYEVGGTPPDFTTTDVDEVAFKLSDYRGKVVVLDFWGFW